jgi:hypothetical protein
VARQHECRPVGCSVGLGVDCSYPTIPFRLGEHLLHGEAPYFKPFDYQGNFVSRAEILALTIVWLYDCPRRVGVNLKLAFGKVGDPISRNPCKGIQSSLQNPIALQCSIGNFDDQGHVLWTGVAIEVLTSITAYHYDIGFWLAILSGDR